MNATFQFRCFLCSVALIALGSMAYAQDLSVSDSGKTGQKAISKAIVIPEDRPLEPVPEPSTGSLIMLGLGGVGLAMKLRQRA